MGQLELSSDHRDQVVALGTSIGANCHPLLELRIIGLVDRAQLSVNPTAAHADHPTTHSGHGGHGLMMMLMCVPMLLIAGLLVVTGAAGTGAVFAAVLCMTMMAATMFTMPGGHSHK